MKYRVALVLIALALSGCGKEEPKKDVKQKSSESEQAENKPKRDNRVPVEVAVIERGVIEAHIDSATNLETESSVKVLSRTTNLVSELKVEEGDKVKKGDVLALLENENQRIALDKARSTYKKNTDEYERQKHLIERKLVSDKGFADTTYQYKQSKLDLDNAQLNYDYTIIKAPIDGTITQRMINLGDQVNNNKHLFDIVDFDTMVARVYVPEEHLPDLKVRQRANVYSQSLPGRSFSGEVVRISPIVDAKSGTVKVTVAVDSEGFLRPGMYVDVSLVTERKEDALLVPKKALAYDDEQTFVYRVANGRAERLAIEPEIIDIEYFKPAGGLLEGDQVVVAGLNGLKDRARVRVINEDAFELEDDPFDLGDDSDDTAMADASKTSEVSKEVVSKAAGTEQEGPNLKEMTREERRAYMQERMKNMTEEERKAFIEERKKRRAAAEQGDDDAA